MFPTWTPQGRLGRTPDADDRWTSVPRHERLPEKCFDHWESPAERGYGYGGEWRKGGKVCDARVALVVLVRGSTWCIWGLRRKGVWSGGGAIWKGSGGWKLAEGMAREKMGCGCCMLSGGGTLRRAIVDQLDRRKKVTGQGEQSESLQVVPTCSHISTTSTSRNCTIST